MKLDIAKPETEMDGAALGKGKNLLCLSLVTACMSNIIYLKEVYCHSARTALPMFPAFPWCFSSVLSNSCVKEGGSQLLSEICCLPMASFLCCQAVQIVLAVLFL